MRTTLCVECGPNVVVDEDGCCELCGNGAVGSWVSEHNPVALLAARDAELEESERVRNKQERLGVENRERIRELEAELERVRRVADDHKRFFEDEHAARVAAEVARREAERLLEQERDKKEHWLRVTVAERDTARQSAERAREQLEQSGEGWRETIRALNRVSDERQTAEAKFAGAVRCVRQCKEALERIERTNTFLGAIPEQMLTEAIAAAATLLGEGEG